MTSQTSFFCNKSKIYIFTTVVAVVLLYWPILHGMVSDWSDDPNFSHGFLVPLISAYFIWQCKDDFIGIEISPANSGLAVVFFSLALLILGYVGTEYFTMRSSLVFLLAGIIVYWFGWPLLKQLALPIGFLFFMVPLPYIVYDSLAFPLKLLVAKFSVLTLKVMGVVVWREGNIIMFPQTVLEVADACSGLRSLMSLLALSVALAFFTQNSNFKRVLLVLSAVPIAIITNMFRVIATGFLAQYYGAAAAEGFFHEFAGLAVFAVAMIMLVALSALLCRVKA